MILDILFPKSCLGCKKGGVYICKKCLSGCHFGGMTNKDRLEIFSIWRYEGVIKKVVISIKYKLATDIGEELINHLIEITKDNKHFNDFVCDKNILLVPIPMHWKKENERGFNQTVVLGKILARKMGWEFLPNLLIKSIKTPPQVGLKGIKRSLNLKKSFEVNNTVASNIDKNIQILLFDDVLTTGSTLLEAYKTLKEEGFKDIKALTIAG